MKLVSYVKDEHEQLALLLNEVLYDADAVHPELPSTMSMLLNYWDDYIPLAKAINDSILQGRVSQNVGIPMEQKRLLAPVTQPASCRDAYTFRRHMIAAGKNGSTGLITANSQFPVFHFTNHHCIQGAGDASCMPDHLEDLDFELKAAIVISKQGRNITASEAEDYIGGYMIMNSLTARRLETEEMLLNLGPAKGKDFAIATGPWLVTPDELEPYKVQAKEGHTGSNYNLAIKCWVNGMLVSEGNLADMDWTFAEIIERCAYGTDLYPGDIIASGIGGTGCFLELNDSGKIDDPAYREQWLQAGDSVELEIDMLGKLANTIVAEASNLSILKERKNG